MEDADLLAELAGLIAESDASSNTVNLTSTPNDSEIPDKFDEEALLKDEDLLSELETLISSDKSNVVESPSASLKIARKPAPVVVKSNDEDEIAALLYAWNPLSAGSPSSAKVEPPSLEQAETPLPVKIDALPVLPDNTPPPPADVTTPSPRVSTSALESVATEISSSSIASTPIRSPLPSDQIQLMHVFYSLTPRRFDKGKASIKVWLFTSRSKEILKQQGGCWGLPNPSRHLLIPFSLARHFQDLFFLLRQVLSLLRLRRRSIRRLV
jgi:hypothetical protein